MFSSYSSGDICVYALASVQGKATTAIYPVWTLFE